ncbi:Sodium-bile acid cotransporter, partial [Operophtera brumata]
RTSVALHPQRGASAFEAVAGSLPVIVTRPNRVIDTIFVTSVATFISFGLGFLIFPDRPDMRLGMFFTGVSPGGGASNIWTFILGGNLNLSLAMSSISTLASFGLLIPLGIGLGMQKWTPRLARFMVRILKGFSTTLLLFIIIFAIIVVAGMCIPWMGYCVGYMMARLFKQPHPDALAISIETGIQNTGIAIFMLRYALPQPEADLTTAPSSDTHPDALAISIETGIQNTGIAILMLRYALPQLEADLTTAPSSGTHPDALAISIETGIQNTGIAIFMLRYALPQPEADLTTVTRTRTHSPSPSKTGIQNTGIDIFMLRYALPQPEADLTAVIPVSVAIMTPIPMTCIYIYQKIMS